MASPCDRRLRLVHSRPKRGRLFTPQTSRMALERKRMIARAIDRDREWDRRVFLSELTAFRIIEVLAPRTKHRRTLPFDAVSFRMRLKRRWEAWGISAAVEALMASTSERARPCLTIAALPWQSGQRAGEDTTGSDSP
jgi:hypothetical protein